MKFAFTLESSRWPRFWSTAWCDECAARSLGRTAKWISWSGAPRSLVGSALPPGTPPAPLPLGVTAAAESALCALQVLSALEHLVATRRACLCGSGQSAHTVMCGVCCGLALLALLSSDILHRLSCSARVQRFVRDIALLHASVASRQNHTTPDSALQDSKLLGKRGMTLRRHTLGQMVPERAALLVGRLERPPEGVAAADVRACALLLLARWARMVLHSALRALPARAQERVLRCKYRDTVYRGCESSFMP